MSYATPFYYAAKAVHDDPYSPRHHPLPAPRRRRIRLVLFPALRPQPASTAVATATSNPVR